MRNELKKDQNQAYEEEKLSIINSNLMNCLMIRIIKC